MWTSLAFQPRIWQNQGWSHRCPATCPGVDGKLCKGIRFDRVGCSMFYLGFLNRTHLCVFVTHTDPSSFAPAFGSLKFPDPLSSFLEKKVSNLCLSEVFLCCFPPSSLFPPDFIWVHLASRAPLAEAPSLHQMLPMHRMGQLWLLASEGSSVSNKAVLSSRNSSWTETMFQHAFSYWGKTTL